MESEPLNPEDIETKAIEQLNSLTGNKRQIASFCQSVAEQLNDDSGSTPEKSPEDNQMKKIKVN